MKDVTSSGSRWDSVEDSLFPMPLSNDNWFQALSPAAYNSIVVSRTGERGGRPDDREILGNEISYAAVVSHCEGNL